MNRFAISGTVAVTGMIDTKNQANGGVRFNVTVTRSNGEVLTIVPLVAFGHAAKVIDNIDGGEAVIGGSLGGRKYQDKRYLDAVADMVLPLDKPKSEGLEGPQDRLDDIPFD